MEEERKGESISPRGESGKDEIQTMMENKEGGDNGNMEKMLMGGILTEETITQIERVFSVFDTKDIGRIEVKELPFILRALNQMPTAEEMTEILVKYDPENTGELDKMSLFRVMENRLRDTDTFQAIFDALKIFDEDQDGRLSNQEFKYAMMTMGRKIPEETVLEMIEKGDSGSSGYIDIHDFATLLMGN